LVWAVALDPRLGLGELDAHCRIGILGEVRVPERVVAGRVTVGRQVPKLAPLPRRLVEEAIRQVRGWQDEERRGPTKVRVLAGERVEDADGGLGIDREHAVLLDVAELTRRRVVEGEDD